MTIQILRQASYPIACVGGIIRPRSNVVYIIILLPGVVILAMKAALKRQVG
jgi:hypothetical protein